MMPFGTAFPALGSSQQCQFGLHFSSSQQVAAPLYSPLFFSWAVVYRGRLERWALNRALVQAHIIARVISPCCRSKIWKVRNELP